jgi:hypothetical protein
MEVPEKVEIELNLDVDTHEKIDKIDKCWVYMYLLFPLLS